MNVDAPAGVACGDGGDGVTVIVTVAGADVRPKTVSVAVYVKVSVPLKPAFGV